MPIRNSKPKIPTFSAVPNPRKGKALGHKGRARCPRCNRYTKERHVHNGRLEFWCRYCPKWFWRAPRVKSRSKPIREIDAATVLYLLRSPIATLCPDADNSGKNSERATCIVDAPDAVTLDLYREMARGGAVVVVEEHGLVYVSLKVNQ